MKILLVSPPVAAFRFGSALLKTRCWQPYSLAIIGAGLEAGGHDVKILDGHALGLSLGETVERTLTERADFLIYSSARHDAWELPTPDFQFIFDFFDQLSPRWRAGAPILIEGPHGTLEPDRLFARIQQLQLVARHEPEETVFEAVKSTPDAAKLQLISNLSYRDANGDVHHNPDGPPIAALDRLPLPAYHLLPMERYREHGDDRVAFSIVVSSRGCPMPCGYCFKEMFGSKLRLRSIASVIEELELLVNKYGVERVYFHDQIFTLNRRRTHELCESIIKKQLPRRLTWRCQTRLNGMKEETLDVMRAAGCIEIQTGLESAAPEIQERILKLDINEFLRYRAYGERIGLKISPNNIIGLPGETRETAFASLRFYHRLGIPYAPNFHFPYPRTPFYQKAREAGEIGDGSFEAIAARAGMVGNNLTEQDLKLIKRKCEVWNRKLRMKQRVWKWFGKSYGALAAGRARGPEAAAPVNN